MGPIILSHTISTYYVRRFDVKAGWMPTRVVGKDSTSDVGKRVSEFFFLEI